MTWTPPKPEPCGPDCTCRTDAHPTGHAAQSIGDHDRRQREVDTELARLRPCRCATSEHPAQCRCPQTPSDRLPPRGTGRPAYQTGRAPAQKNPAAERAPGGVSDQPSATAAFGITEFGHRVDIHRPGLLRRIWDAARKASR